MVRPDVIDHVVVLMLENRSFDSMLGTLYPKSQAFEGLDGSEFNLDQDGNKVPVWNSAGADPKEMNIPAPDPGELFLEMNMQLFGTPTPEPGATPTMGGLVRSYQQQASSPEMANRYVADAVMHHYRPDQVPVISALARQFAVSDRWHASAPCQTWPNRFFAHAGTANGFKNNEPPHFPYEMPTIFNRFDDADVKSGWKIYFHDIPHALTLAGLWDRLDRFRYFDEFLVDARQGTLPCYSFVEPRYFADIRLPNDQHPPHGVTLGEQLIADVYNAVRAGPAWLKTLLIVTYDEHGGCYDHVPPPKAVPPGHVASEPFNFDRYGVRVPAVLVSPWIAPGTILRPAAADGGSIPFDHTSLISSLRERFQLGEPLSERDAVAPTVWGVLGLQQPTNIGPERLQAHAFAPTPAMVARAQDLPFNHMQNGLLEMTRRLPGATAGDAQADKALAGIHGATNVLASRADASPRDQRDAVACARSRLDAAFAFRP